MAAEQQAPCRQREHQARCRAVQFCQLPDASCSHAARQLGIAPRTLRHWKLQQERADWEPRPLGRPPKESSLELRREAWSLLQREGPVGVATLQAELGMPRSELIDLRRDYQDWHRAKYRMGQQHLKWKCPGSVWAIDHTKPPAPVDGRFPYILSVRDLASGLELAWQPVTDYTAETTIAVVGSLFAQHGAPLVMKSDNGPAFKSQEWFALLAAWWITPLLSPPYAPWYNGSCERGIGAMKIRTSFFAARYGRLGYWTRADLDDAERQANRLHRPEHRPNATAQQVWDARAAIGDQMRTAFDQALLSHRAAIAKRATLQEKDAPASHVARERAKLEREAVREALVESGLLSVTWRSVPLPLKAKKAANIT